MRTLIFVLVGLISLACFKSKELDLKEPMTINDSIFAIIDTMGFDYPKVIKAQVILETGNFSSRVYKQNNNLFGMRLPKSRMTTATSSNYGYAVYPDLISSIEDRLIYDTLYFKNLNRKQYLNKLDRIYAADPNYIQHLEKIIQKNFAD
jgi:flagellum-specific peptidoglycan hydrolase FlgJ